jgi:hypothetical protein
MQNRPLPWLLSLPLMAAGCLGAHSAAYRLVEPAAPEPAHGYLTIAPLLLAIGVALGLVAALGSVAAGRSRAVVSVRLFALLPPLAFTLQEHLERAFQPSVSALETALDPVFLVGLALQLPFALGAVAVARSLLRAAEVAGAGLLRPPRVRIRASRILHPALSLDTPRSPVLSSRHAGRAPPLAA